MKSETLVLSIQDDQIVQIEAGPAAPAWVPGPPVDAELALAILRKLASKFGSFTRGTATFEVWWYPDAAHPHEPVFLVDSDAHLDDAELELVNRLMAEAGR